ncbi:MAG TPA: hypothetical protein EYP53_00125 [Candidatus Latescibacteria bacterium]|nr:hypothetical protein [Candidatus Latescibacterota bacterium]
MNWEEEVKPRVEENTNPFSDLSRVSGYIIWHENYNFSSWDANDPSPHLENMIEWFKSNWSGKDILLVGNLNEKWKGEEPPYKVVPDEVRKRAWKYDECIWVHDCYHWVGIERDGEWEVKPEKEVRENLQKDWRAIADKRKADQSDPDVNEAKWIHMYNSTRDKNSGLALPPKEKDYWISAIGPVAHGAIGSAVYQFDWYEEIDGNNKWLSQDDMADRRSWVKNAFTRRDTIKGYLTGFEYHAEYSENAKDGNWIEFPSDWNHLKKIVTSGGNPLDFFDRVEVCKWDAPSSPAESYVVCNHDPDSPNKELDSTFRHPCHVWIDNVDKGGPHTSYHISLGPGNAFVLRLTPWG